MPLELLPTSSVVSPHYLPSYPSHSILFLLLLGSFACRPCQAKGRLVQLCYMVVKIRYLIS